MSSLGVDSAYVKIEDTNRTVIPVKNTDEEFQLQRAENLKITFFDNLGYGPKENTT